MRYDNGDVNGLSKKWIVINGRNDNVDIMKLLWIVYKWLIYVVWLRKVGKSDDLLLEKGRDRFVDILWVFVMVFM